MSNFLIIDRWTQETHFQNGEVVVDKQCQDHAWNQQEFNSEWVVIVVVCCAEFQIHQIEHSQWRGYEDHLHEGVVDADEGGEEIQVSTEVDDRK
jgi:hypothetical protein